MKTLFNDGCTVPTAFVTRGRQRVKQYNNNTVYLNNGDEFEIELFNPTTNKVLAKIELNGVSLDSGIVLRPGERVFLERYLNEAKRFLFETYEVDGNNNAVKKAIENNGKVEVFFYTEQTYYFGSVTLTGGCSYWENGLGYPTFTYSSIGGYVPQSKTANCFYSQSDQNLNFSGPSVGTIKQSCSSGTRKLSKESIETGRIEKGSNSSQSFTYDNTSFNTWWSWTSEWKILPSSQKPFETRDLKVFCTSCGMKQRKQSDRFCPKCGTQY